MTPSITEGSRARSAGRERAEAYRAEAYPVWLFGALLLWQLTLCAAASAQDADVAVLILGTHTEDVSAVLQNVMPTARRFETRPDPIPDDIEFLLTLDTSAVRTWVWRRRDGVVLEHPAVEVDDAFAFGIMAYELLQVARAAGDPEATGMVVREAPDPPTDPAPVVPAAPEATGSQATGTQATGTQATGAQATGAQVTVPARDSAATGEGVEPGPAELPPDVHSGDRAEPPPDPETQAAPRGVSVAIGVGVDAWLSLETEGPFIVQPTLSLDVDGWPTGQVLVGAGLSVSALGGYGAERGGVNISYARHDFVGRAFVGGELGSARTRLLGHLRVGGSVVVAHAERGELESERILPSLQLGLGLEVRQPLVEGFELFLAAQVDLIPEPLYFTGLGQTLVREPRARLGAQLGLGWRFR